MSNQQSGLEATTVKPTSMDNGGSGRPTLAIICAVFAAGIIAFVGLSLSDMWTKAFSALLITVVAVTIIYGLLTGDPRPNVVPKGPLPFVVCMLFCAIAAVGISTRQIDDLPNRLIAIAAIILIFSITIIFRTASVTGFDGLRSAFRDYIVAIVGAIVSIIVGFVIILAAQNATPDGEDFKKVILQGVSASIVEDIIFFSLVGAVLIFLQRRDADRNRNLDDKIELLFSAKSLRSGEAAYLREEVKGISADCIEVVTEIDIVDYDEKEEIIELDVSRRFYVGNYLDSDSAYYTLTLNTVPDDIRCKSPCMYVYPTIANTVVKDQSGDWVRWADDEILEPAVSLNAGEAFRPSPKRLEIRPRQVREFRTRFRAWQTLYAERDEGGERPLDRYELSILKHWDEVQIHMRNSLKRPVKVTISGSESREIELAAGDEQQKAYRIVNLSAKSRIDVVFDPR